MIGGGMLSISRLVEPEPIPAAPESESRRHLPKPETTPDGAIAQLGERLHGMQEVSGSIPLSSTKLHAKRCCWDLPARLCSPPAQSHLISGRLQCFPRKATRARESVQRVAMPIETREAWNQCGAIW
ncbi:hypothetical protein KL86PLE_60096 [uncultured Pleomorphomonas sp.]|uniref:Uncharacterized protein n=1 Tax=uncultured Pleomorphomonas sp. TaxID=442121 RepID=A0A212LJQ3_9HYPH|nr:hypothetical protein KL86PLE_60096 [uncultured Pleomorphomonas sp.]